jgi:hypothetical protein
MNAYISLASNFILGLSVSYDRVLAISTALGNHATDRYHEEGLVCPPQLRSHIFTTSAVDNIDHNPSSNTSQGSLHGTGISGTSSNQKRQYLNKLNKDSS